MLDPAPDRLGARRIFLHHPGQFQVDGDTLAEGLGVRVQSGTRQEAVGEVIERDFLPHAQPVFVVQGVTQRVVENPEAFGHLAPPEHRRLAEIADIQEPFVVPRLGRVFLQDRPIRVQVVRASVEREAVRVRGEMRRHCRERAGIVHVVGVQVREHVAGAGAQAAVDRVSLAVVLLRHPADRLSARQEAPLFEDLHGTVRAAAVEDEHFHVRVVLRADALPGRGQVVRLVVGRDDDGDFHRGANKGNSRPSSSRRSAASRWTPWVRLSPALRLAASGISSHSALRAGWKATVTS